MKIYTHEKQVPISQPEDVGKEAEVVVHATAALYLSEILVEVIALNVQIYPRDDLLLPRPGDHIKRVSRQIHRGNGIHLL